MTDLPADFKAYLSEHFDFNLPIIKDTYPAQDGAIKFLLELNNKTHIEMVLMPEGDKQTLCLSSQAGCKRQCSFCATGSLGFIRNLTPEEIVAQVILAGQYLQDKHLTNLVFMGMGEPLDNLEHVLSAIKIIQSDYALQFSPRRITLSTCGIIPQIYALTQSGIRVKLAVSLNSAIPEKRSALMPINRIYPLDELKKAIQQFRSISPWRVTFEYIMIPEINLGEADALALITFLGDISCKLNLIAWNPVADAPWRSPTEQEALAFQSRLRHLPIAVTIRKSRGSDVNAACGQLALKNK